ncbi:MAG TPA: DedA family protein [Methylomirabilota bacterium]|nr:DedA family protein [Methylomirabilota bacterium]
MINDFIEQFTYLGVFMVLFLGGLGAPIPEELPVLAAGALAHEGYMRWWIALPVCFIGVLSGDAVLYWVGHHWGERILDWRIVRRVLTPEREKMLLEAYRRHAAKTVFTARHVMGLRAAAFLTAGIARVPFWKFIGVDAAAALLGVPTGFALAYFFTDQLAEILHDVKRVERWLLLLGLTAIAAWLAVLEWRKSRRLDQPPPDGVL